MQDILRKIIEDDSLISLRRDTMVRALDEQQWNELASMASKIDAATDTLLRGHFQCEITDDHRRRVHLRRITVTPSWCDSYEVHLIPLQMFNAGIGKILINYGTGVVEPII